MSDHLTSGYIANARRQVPGLEALHRMTALLLQETVPASARLLVLGAGGGMETKALAETSPGWRFDGVDPSTDMLALARQTLHEFGPRMSLHEGSISAAPDGPFDAAVSLLTFHFIAPPERLETLRQMRARMRRGAPLILAHISFAQSEPERAKWIARHVAYGLGPSADPAKAEESRRAIATRLHVLSPSDEEAMLAEAGFSGIELFYCALSFRGWVAYA
ncbi:methyltransferase [Devosia pacifica]|uniref:Methyltransferase n=1 Tax=Devosia pacifica TaxID=1335967 RepID=A0A918RVZ0_9HYPH|nr:class I SAM-dependent methyltransferase [Devosia pacifica]GHA13117.1 methyltransferase [Devosia pacifica]